MLCLGETKLSLKLFIMRNCGRWSEIEVVRLPETISKSVEFVNILSIRVFEVSDILVGKEICGKMLFDDKILKNSDELTSSSHFNKSI